LVSDSASQSERQPTSESEWQPTSQSEWQPESQTEWQPRPLPEEFQVRGEYHGWFTRWMLFLMGLFGFELLLIGLSHANLLGEKIPIAMFVIFLFAGIPLFFASHIWFISRVYQESPGYALAALFMPIFSIIAVVKFPDRTKRAFVGRFICLGIVLCSMAIPQDAMLRSQVTHVDEKRQVRLEYPDDWSVHENAQFGTLVVASPDYGSEWKAAVAINAFRDKEWSSASEQRIAEYLEDLRTQKRDYLLKSTRPFYHPSNLSGVEIVYTCADRKTGIPMTKRAFLLWHPDGRVIEINESAYTPEWGRFEPALNKIVESVRPTY